MSESSKPECKVENCTFNVGGCDDNKLEAYKAVAGAYIAHSRALEELARTLLESRNVSSIHVGDKYE